MVDIINTGTVVFTSGSKVVNRTGGSAWVSVQPGDLIDSPVGARIIESLTDSDTLQLATNYPGATTGAVAYAIVPASERWGTNLTLAQKTQALIELLSDSAMIEALGTLTPVANRVPIIDASGNPALSILTAFARTLLDDPDAATMLATLGAVNKAGDQMTGALRNSAQPAVRASRNTNSETLTVGTYGILGTMGLNQGVFTAGAVLGSGSVLIVPTTGLYRVGVSIFSTGTAGGRLSVLRNNAAAICFAVAGASGVKTHGEGFAALTAGDTLNYDVSQATLSAWHAANHTEMYAQLIG